ncbi:Small nuclear RNA activating complex, polypeptide 1, 43kDa [Blomia tropicalis]|nr:Small nuclear RNA activating complex, polypeptide 1, 43kDa [Blomia tropicalis]
MNGFKLDYEKLLRLFRETSSVQCQLPSSQIASSSTNSRLSETNEQCQTYEISFSIFINCFRELKFSSILCGHRNMNSLRELSEKINEYLLSRTAPFEPIVVRIFSFYLLYTLWFVQTKCYELPIKIRLDKVSYKNLKNLIQYSTQQQQFDVVLAYRKLLLADAYAFCHSSQQYGPYYKDFLTQLSNTTIPVEIDSESTFLESFKKDKLKYINELNQITEQTEKQFDCESLLNLMKDFEENSSL